MHCSSTDICPFFNQIIPRQSGTGKTAEFFRNLWLKPQNIHLTLRVPPQSALPDLLSVGVSLYLYLIGELGLEENGGPECTGGDGLHCPTNQEVADQGGKPDTGASGDGPSVYLIEPILHLADPGSVQIVCLTDRVCQLNDKHCARL